MFNLMIVEEKKWVRFALRQMVAKTELPFRTVTECATGKEALAKLNQQHIDLVLIDIREAIKEGFSFVVEARRHKPQAIIVISGTEDFFHIRPALRAGVIDYLLKPVEACEMRKCLEKWIAKSIKQKRGRDHRATRKHVEQITQYVEDHLSESISLGEAAARVHLNQNYLSQLFKRQTGKNFVRYVLEARMDKAKQRLVHTSLSITEIAEQVGYANVAYFSNTFKKMTGESPTQYRKRHRRLQ